MRKNDKYITVAMFAWMIIISVFYGSIALAEIGGQPYKFIWIGPNNLAQEYTRPAREPLPYYWPFASPQFKVSGEKIMQDFVATYDPTMTREKYVPTGQPIIPLS